MTVNDVSDLNNCCRHMICGEVLEAVSDIYSTVCSIDWLYKSINHSQME
jgi:hypothetical protein